MLCPLPPGVTTDGSAEFGLFRLMNAVNDYCGSLISIATTSANAVVITPAQFSNYSVFRLTSGATGGYTITLPATTTLLADFAPCAIDGTFGVPFSVLNDNVAQTGTLTAGDASTTITGTATIATNVRRDYMIVVTGATTVTVYNIGSASI